MWPFRIFFFRQDLKYPRWPWTYYLAKNNLEFLIFQTLGSPHRVYAGLEGKLRDLCVLGEYSANWVTSQLQGWLLKQKNWHNSETFFQVLLMSTVPLFSRPSSIPQPGYVTRCLNASWRTDVLHFGIMMNRAAASINTQVCVWAPFLWVK